MGPLPWFTVFGIIPGAFSAVVVEASIGNPIIMLCRVGGEEAPIGIMLPKGSTFLEIRVYVAGEIWATNVLTTQEPIRVLTAYATKLDSVRIGNTIQICHTLVEQLFENGCSQRFAIFFVRKNGEVICLWHVQHSFRSTVTSEFF